MPPKRALKSFPDHKMPGETRKIIFECFRMTYGQQVVLHFLTILNGGRIRTQRIL